MRCRAYARDRLAGLDVVGDMLHLIVGKIAEAGQDDHEIGGVERLEARDIVETVGVDGAVIRVDGEQDSASKAVPHRKDFGELRKQFLGSVFFVAADENDILPIRFSMGLENQKRFGCPAGYNAGKQCGQNRQPECAHATLLSSLVL